MPTAVLSILKLCLLAVIYLFIARVVRAVWVEIRTDRQPGDTAASIGATSRRDRRRAAKAESAGAKPRLKILEPPAQLGATFSLDDEVTIGRAPGCAVVQIRGKL